MYSLYLGLVGSVDTCTLVGDNMAQVIDLLLGKGAFGQLNLSAIIGQQGQHKFKMTQVILPSLVVH